LGNIDIQSLAACRLILVLASGNRILFDIVR